MGGFGNEDRARELPGEIARCIFSAGCETKSEIPSCGRPWNKRYTQEAALAPRNNYFAPNVATTVTYLNNRFTFLPDQRVPVAVG